MQEFKTGDLVRVKGAKDSNWFNIGEVFKVRRCRGECVFVDSVEGESYQGYVPLHDNGSSRIWINPCNLEPVIDPEIEEFLINLEKLQKVIEEAREEESVKMVLDLMQIELAADFCSYSNPYIDESPEYYEAAIIDVVENYDGQSCSSTLGFYVLFQEDYGVVYVDVLVNPALMLDTTESIEVKLEDGKLFQEF